MDNFVTLDKMTTIVADLLTAEVWKAKIFPQIKSQVA